MTIRIICIGKKHDPLLAQAIDRYEALLRPHAKLLWDIIPSSDKRTESEKILKRVGREDYLVVLDERGVLVRNDQFAQTLEDVRNNSKVLLFVIGGAYGVENSVRVRANAVWSLSGLVLPHQLMRLLLAEQIYRSFSILSGGKYHHE